MDKLLEEFIKDWRLKNNSKDAIYSSYHYDAMIEFAKHYHSQQLILSGVSKQRELLKVLIDTDTDVDLISGHKCRLLKYTEERFLIQYNHNDQIEWVVPSELSTKNL